MPTDAQRLKRIDRAQLRVLFTVPFFAAGVARLKNRFDTCVDTACTDGSEIIWNPDWFDKLQDEVVPTVLCHEAAHCLLGHLWRAPTGCDWDRWNQATDHAVNNMLKEYGELVANKRLANPFPFPKPEEDYCMNPAYKGMAEEHIYSLIPPNKSGSGGSPAGQGKRGKGKAGSGQGPNAPAGSTAGKGNGQANSAGRPKFGEMMKPKGSTADQKKQKNDWDAALMQSIAASKGRGDIPGNLQRYVDELISPTVPWWEIVRNWLREQCSDDYNWMKPNQYFDDSNFILPSLDSEKIGPIVFATDTSGSIDQHLLAQFQSEKQTCLDDLKPSRLVDICCDTRITQEKEYRVGDRIDAKAPGGGGTDFRPVFDRMEELPESPRCVVYLTDLQGVFPDKHPDYQVLWVVWGGADLKAPFGDVVKA